MQRPAMPAISPAPAASTAVALENGPPSSTLRVEATCWAELTSAQRKSGAAAWLGWFFDGLDMHLFTLVAAPVVAMLLGPHVLETDPAVKTKSALIQASFLVGWALGGAFFGRLG